MVIVQEELEKFVFSIFEARDIAQQNSPLDIGTPYMEFPEMYFEMQWIFLLMLLHAKSSLFRFELHFS